MIRLWCLLSSLFIVCISACSSNTELGDLSSYTETELVAMIAAENDIIKQAWSEEYREELKKKYSFSKDIKDTSETKPYGSKKMDKNTANIKALRKEISRRNK